MRWWVPAAYAATPMTRSSTNYIVDEGETKDLAATVDYKSGKKSVGDHIDLNTTVQVLQPDTLSNQT